ncbi:hypothetical protein L227DRAFT_614087 [Lentinus tigrinus ALCF2SS1-6]|uniref:Uncharacterized protein n=2 Tax=Lentinus tigrinus TaxID=5365 RepID=A0A5C2S0U9_9APHY|nr:hypothetical protein L227DRAFT_614087 [Lentinus tigrinus ALCF2SS1-6]
MADDLSKHGESTLKDALQRTVHDNDVHDEGKDEIAASTQGDERAKGGDWEEVKGIRDWIEGVFRGCQTAQDVGSEGLAGHKSAKKSEKGEEGW